ncbi:hypothetical protein L1987_78232 [Smallanthus sonchifolius]|uniref:Uncharacterized protein n=1 Tax=Smallanthus sonchifolius TaxID=185202 RepID=A0ACB8ZC43_9ASTR|nr:hypothetical protein L1987_78232 [Smallanthus sonchifolius]
MQFFIPNTLHFLLVQETKRDTQQGHIPSTLVYVGHMACNSLFVITISTFLIFTTVAGRVITTTSSSDLLTDGVHDGILRLNPFVSADESEACEQTYGFLPCTNTALGNLSYFGIRLPHVPRRYLPLCR